MLRDYLARIGVFEVISFTTGFALMAFELAAARILAPSIGSSTYVWTSVIGVIIAALALGYAVGGKMADMRVKPMDVAWLLLLSALGIIMSLLFAESMLSALNVVFEDARLRGLFASLFLFAPASFLLGMIAPYLVRLRIASLETSGESVALLSALNSVGGIVGTFAAGFVFFGYIGSQETLALLIGLLLLSSWLVLPRQVVRSRALATAGLALLALYPFLVPAADEVVAQADTPSANYRVRDVVYNGEGVRVLTMGPTGFQSGVYTDGRDELVFPYAEEMARVVAQAPEKQDILLLGGGAFTLPEYFAKEYPQSHIDVVEIDPDLEQLAVDHFRYTQPDNVSVIAKDARTFLNDNEKQYDIILVDIYSDTSIPFAVATQQYGDQIAAALHSDGVVVANIIAAYNEQCAPLLQKVHAAYTQHLPEYTIFPQRDPTLQERQNLIITYTAEVHPWLDTTEAVKRVIAKDTPLTDSYAPLERLHRHCTR